MLGLMQRERGLASKLIGEIVPLGIALATAAFAAPFLGVVGGGLLFLVAWALVSWLLVRIRRHPLLRRIYRGAVLAHVAVWAVLGWTASTVAPPGAPHVVATLATDEAHPLVAGFGEAAFELPERTTLAGWGTRPRRVNLPALGGFGVLGRASLEMMGPPAPGVPPRRPMFRHPDGSGEALGARALFLRARDGQGGVAFLRLDLIVMEPRLLDAVLARTSSLGLDAATLIITATHTHSAPGGVSLAPLAQVVGTDHHDVTVFDAIVDASVRALDRAASALRPARLTFAEGRDMGAGGLPLLAKTRGPLGDADPSGDADRADTRVLFLRVDGVDGSAIGVLLNYGVQPVVVRPRQTYFSRDLAGALEAAFQASLPGRPPVLFVNGHCGDVTPRRDGAAGPDAVRALAERFANAVTPSMQASASSDLVRIEAARVHRDFGAPRAFVAAGRGEALYPALTHGVLGRSFTEGLGAALAFPANLAVWSLTLTEVRLGLSLSGAAGVLVNLDSHMPRREHAVGAVRIRTPEESRLFLWHPAVGTQALGKAIRARFGEPTPFLLAFANGACGYLTTREEYVRGGYEAHSSLYGPAGGRLLEEALQAAVEAVGTR